jgi:GH35 family endo-1,4-beta-xylanase
MVRYFFSLLFLTFSFFIAALQIQAQDNQNNTVPDNTEVMSKAYWERWNPEVQARIDQDIEKYRKADAVLKMEDLPVGAEVKVEQISHDFIFGAHIFNFNQLGTTERNRKYKELYGTLFNSATIAFYWKTFEMQPNRPRYREEYWDTEEFWNEVDEPNAQPHWRRPASDPVVEFCESKGIRLHGHPITWGDGVWHYPEWLYEEYCPEEEKEKINKMGRDKFFELTPEQITELVPNYVEAINTQFMSRIYELAEYYGDRIHSWDVVNEAAINYEHGRLVPGTKISKRYYGGLMPGDYAYESFKRSNRVFPENVVENINDYRNDEHYINMIKDLQNRGCEIDVMGSQMHLFKPQQCLDIAAGAEIMTPEQVWKDMEILSQADLPIHLSEITITSPGGDERGEEIQAVIARNLYRLWFSVENMMGITWWNVVDGCGAPGEPATSGLFSRNMEPKPSFYALDNLINNEWKTKTKVKVGEDGTAKFRGFRGRYLVKWKDKYGKEQKAEFYLKNDGDGFRTFP